MMSTKYPLTLLAMELSETLRPRSCEPNLQWIPREKNQLADDLTNEKFDSFEKDEGLKRAKPSKAGKKRWLEGR